MTSYNGKVSPLGFVGWKLWEKPKALCFFFPHAEKLATHRNEGSHPISNSDGARGLCKMPPQLLSSETTLQHPLLPSSGISRRWQSWAVEQSPTAVTFTVKENPVPAWARNPFGF